MTEGFQDRTDPPADQNDGSTAVDPNPIPEFWRNPGPQDKAIFALFGLAVALGVAGIPLRVYLLNHPWLWVTYNGSETGMVVSGADVRVHGASWLAPWLLGIFGAVHTMPLWWWMGHRWGRAFIDTQVANYRFIERNYERFERWSLRYAPLVIFMCFVPGVPIPLALVVFVLADAGMSLRRFLVTCVVALAAVQGINLYLGYVFGHQVVEVVRRINHYGTWITLALVVWIVFRSMRRAQREQAGTAGTSRHAAPRPGRGRPKR